MSTEIDLRTCKPGDLLLSNLGSLLRYVGPLPVGNYFDHIVEYVTEKIDKKGRVTYKITSTGTRTHEGFAYRKNRLSTDHNIVTIIGQ